MSVGFGILAPPVNLNVYVVNCMAKDTSMAESYRRVMPFLISDTLRMAAVICLPGIAFGLVRFVS